MPSSIFEHFRLLKSEYVVVDSKHVFLLSVVDDINNNNNEEEAVLLSRIQREYLKKDVVDIIQLEKIDRKDIPEIKEIEISIELCLDIDLEIREDDFIEKFLLSFSGSALNKSQLFYFRYNDLTLKCCASNLVNSNSKESKGWGIIGKASIIKPTTKDKRIHLQTKRLPTLDLPSLGIGGLSKEFTLMFRRAFLQRTLSTDINEKLGTEYVKGIILFGPPGTGKTLIARKISHLLNCKRPKVVSGPEILDKYVGESEKNIRELFREAEEEYKKSKEGSSLHIIIFDEIDAICKQRSQSNSNHSDNIVNQILSKMDGIDRLNNVLVIGMTNRIDLLDSALLRPGRFEIKIEISLPDYEGRVEILDIHTRKLKESRLMRGDICSRELAGEMVNYTGAEIAAVVKSAVSFALERSSSKTERNELKINESLIQIENEDFKKAIKEIQPLFGNSKLPEPAVFYSFVPFNSIIEEALLYINKLKGTDLYNTSSLLIYGEKGSGKTALASRIASLSQIPFIRMVSPVHLIGLSDFERVGYIKSIFYDAYKSELSLIILDDLEALIGYVSIGPRFSNDVLQCLKLFTSLSNINTNTSNTGKGGKGSKVFVVGTCVNEEIITELGLWDCFDYTLEVPLINKDLLQSEDGDLFRNVELVEDVTVKKLLGMLNV